MRRFSIGGNELARDMLEDTDEQAETTEADKGPDKEKVLGSY